ncbi:MAG TPA: HEAT repeat domain-containing protein [Candidatus Saccharimonadales bacterium]|nr:HEAT repeat domain-containing protein [Candidatus Saccharimonadales bacterium]
MKSEIVLGLELVVCSLAAQAHVTRAWGDAELEYAADLAVIGRPVEVKDLNETNSLGWTSLKSFQSRFRGVETTFKVSTVLKGALLSDEVVLHHYREVLKWGDPPNGPEFLTFTPGSTNKYLLYLVKDSKGRYAPVAGQVDPELSIKELENPDKLVLEIRCTNSVFKMGDEIPVQFVISNRGKSNYMYEDRNYDRSGRMQEYRLTAKSTAGTILPDPRAKVPPGFGGGLFSTSVLHPGEAFTKTIPLNLWARFTGPGQWAVTGFYTHNGEDKDNNALGVESEPIHITILPRSENEMDDYIAGLTNQLAKNKGARAFDADAIWMKLAFTGSPKIVPFVLNEMFQSPDVYWEQETLAVYVPHTAEVRKEIVETASRRGLAEGLNYVLAQYGCTSNEWRWIIGRSLAEDNSACWKAGAMAAQAEPYDIFVPRLIAIATGAQDDLARSRATYALGQNGNSEALQAIEQILRDPPDEVTRITADDVLFRARKHNGGNSGGPSVEWLNYTNLARHFHLSYPANWKTDTEVLPVAHYDLVFFSLNSMGRSQFRLKELQTASNVWQLTPAEILQEIPPGGAYIDIGSWEAPWPRPPASEQMTGDNLSELLTKAVERNEKGELIRREIDFWKWDQHWMIEVCMRPHVGSGLCGQVQRILESFRFDKPSAPQNRTP